MSRTKLKAFSAFFAIAITFLTPLQAGWLYMMNGSGNLSSYDTNTGVTDDIGIWGAGSFDGGLSFGAGHQLYAINGNGSFYSIDRNTGAETFIGNTGLTGSESLAYTLDGRMLTIAGTSLYELNTTNATATFIRSGVVHGDGMTVAPVAVNTSVGVLAAGTIFFSDPASGVGNALWAMDANAPMAFQFVKTNPLSVVDETLEFDEFGNMLSHNYNRNSGVGGLSMMDLTGSSHVNLGNTSTGVFGSAYLSSSAVPEPSTYALLVLGLLGLGVYSKKRKK